MVDTLAALVAVISATGQTRAGRRLCAALLDTAVEGLKEPGPMTEALGADRASAIGVLGDICAACRACPRGWMPGDGDTVNAEPVMAER